VGLAAAPVVVAAEEPPVVAEAFDDEAGVGLGPVAAAVDGDAGGSGVLALRVETLETAADVDMLNKSDLWTVLIVDSPTNGT
jgi:hypothetical protein